MTCHSIRVMDREASYWRSEYEGLRRKSNLKIYNLNAQISKMQYQQADMCEKTYNLLKSLNISDQEIINYFGKGNYEKSI